MFKKCDNVSIYIYAAEKKHKWLNKSLIYKLMNFYFFELSEMFAEKTDVVKSFLVR